MKLGLPYGFERDGIPASYEAVDWQMRLERIPSDYEPPQHSNGPLVPFYDLERDSAYMLEEHPYW